MIAVTPRMYVSFVFRMLLLLVVVWGLTMIGQAAAAPGRLPSVGSYEALLADMLPQRLANKSQTVKPIAVATSKPARNFKPAVSVAPAPIKLEAKAAIPAEPLVLAPKSAVAPLMSKIPAPESVVFRKNSPSSTSGYTDLSRTSGQTRIPNGISVTMRDRIQVLHKDGKLPTAHLGNYSGLLSDCLSGRVSLPAPAPGLQAATKAFRSPFVM